MLSYQARRRRFTVPNGELHFPSRVTVTAILQPSEQLGVGDGPTRTILQSMERSIIMDANTGKAWALPPNPIRPLNVEFQRPGAEHFALRGNELTVTAMCGDLEELNSLCEEVYYAIPPLLNLEFADSSLVARVYGDVDGVAFRWELEKWMGKTEVTTQALQEERALAAFRRVERLVSPESRRLFAALHFFHQACRLERAGHTPWEFMGEVVLDLCKVLETLFPGPDGQTREAARGGLRQFGYSDEEIERDFLPIMALRSEVDSGHVGLALFTARQLEVFHRYTEQAEQAFRELVRRVFRLIEEGRYQLPQIENVQPSRSALNLVERLAKSLGMG